MEIVKDQLGIVLSGGGVRGIAHIGLLKALDEHGLHPQVLSGSSAGALAGALYAAGYTPDEMIMFFKKTPLFKFSFYSASKPGLLDTEKYRIFFEEYFPENDFAQLSKPVYISASDLVNARNVVFSEGELIKPLLASAALPPLFSPVEINGHLYADGGILNNFPVEPLKTQCEFIIGSFVNPVKVLTKKYFSNSARLFQRATDLRFYADASSKFRYCDYVFQPKELAYISFLDTKNIDQVFDIGYKTALKEMEDIKRAIDAHRTELRLLRPSKPKNDFPDLSIAN